MAEKKEAIGLSLLDVLSNALLGGIVLMMVSAVSVSVSNMQSELDKDDEFGFANVNTRKQFKPVDKQVLTDSLLLCAFETKGGDPNKYSILYEELNDKIRKQGGGCISISRGLYERQYWLVSRECNWPDGSWGIFMKGERRFLPDTIFVNITLGIRPLGSASDINKQYILKTDLEEYEHGSNQYKLVFIYETATGYPKINY